MHLDFQNVTTRVACFEIGVEFNFSNNTLQTLAKTLSTFPMMKNEERTPLLKLGSTVNSVNLDTIKNVLALSKDRVRVDVSGTDLFGIFQRSKHANLLVHSGKIEDLDKSDQKFFQDIV